MTGADDNDAQGNRLVVMQTTERERERTLPSLTASSGRNRMSPGHNRDDLMIAVHGRQDPIVGENFTPALDSDESGSIAVADEVSVRRLTPLECSRLQGFPDDWLDGLGLSDSTKYAQLGNAVAVPVVEWIARRLVAVDAALGQQETVA